MQDQTTIILSAIAPESSGLLPLLTKACSKNQCDILDTRAHKVGEDALIMMVVCGSWHAIAKLEANLHKIEEKTNLSIQCKRTTLPTELPSGLPYQIHVIAENTPGILSELCGFFSRFAVQIEECLAETYQAARSGTLMCSIQLNLQVSPRTHLAHLREKFISYCEDRNLDATFEPVK